jgi:hypothetical protein
MPLEASAVPDACSPRCYARTCGPDGCGGSCGLCPSTAACSLVSGTCVPSGVQVVAVRGSISPRDPWGNSWDIGSGPDPYLCLEIYGVRSCSRVLQDTVAPAWDDTIIPEIQADRFINATLSGYLVEIMDRDIDGEQVVCSGLVRGSRTSLADGEEFTVGCDYGEATFAVFFVRK